MIKNQKVKLYSEIKNLLTEKAFLKEIIMTKNDMLQLLNDYRWEEMAALLLEKAVDRGKSGRFNSTDVVDAAKPTLDSLCEQPGEGWLKYTYSYVLGQLFPEKKPDEGDGKFHKGRLLLLQLLKALYKYERQTLAFDPTVDIRFPRLSEIEEAGYNSEYKRFDKLARSQYLYEFMRIGVDMSPFNTLGHIAGVHYVAMHIARQLAFLGIPVDLGLVSGAAAGHDIGKYGSKKSEERRVPYLHYYYTDICFNRFNMPMIGHIAANHSTWDLELENLSVESLILIYADFRVKSRRNEEGLEEVCFYSLKESFEVILNKLDNVDAVKELRYRRVYNKLKDFEDYMIYMGASPELPQIPEVMPKMPIKPPDTDAALLRSAQVVEAFKHEAIEHNIRLMNRFYREDEFGNFLETARSEKKWKNLRTYISIFGEYSTYMTEKQKLMTLRFLYELLAHKESDIRNQAGDVMGLIIAKFNEEYKKELPEGVHLPKKKVTNLSLWETYIEEILRPDHKLTEQHKKWIGNSLKNVICALSDNCDSHVRAEYLDALLKWCTKPNLTNKNKEAILRAAFLINSDYFLPRQVKAITSFADKVIAGDETELKVAAVRVKAHYSVYESDEEYIKCLKDILDLDTERALSREALSDMYLDNLKARTPWSIKVANITLMLKYLEKNPTEGQALHVATHLGNLVKVSETVTVRRAAGEGLLSIIGKMPLEQRNEIAVELGKGLEIGDYQFSKYIPDYLGIIMLHLPPRELDELIIDLEKFLEATNDKVAAAVLHTFGVVLENYHLYRANFGTEEVKEITDKRKSKLLNIIIRGFANYNNGISQEALWTIGTHIFGSDKLSLQEKYEIFCHCSKKILTIFQNVMEETLGFFNNAAALNHIYRFICHYEVERGAFSISERNKVAFFPGTFDPFSLSHKAIAAEISSMGYEVYLALDEFSWSKKTQPRLQRRKIMTMSVADEENIYIFPDNIPVNIANPSDLDRLRGIFRGRELYFVAGSDVIKNASCYRAEPCENSIHAMNHIIFKRDSAELAGEALTKGTVRPAIRGKVINLTLEKHYEDISSTRIRENIDLNRDISNLIDPVAQNYIYENSLYLREPPYKHVLQSSDIKVGDYVHRTKGAMEDMSDELSGRGYNINLIYPYLDREDTKTIVIRDGLKGDSVVAMATAAKVDSINLLDEFKNSDIAAFVRRKASGGIGVIKGFYYSKKTSITNLGQILLTELISELISRDFAYIIYDPCDEAGLNARTIEVMEKQGFINIAPKGERPIYAADTKAPVILFKNVKTIIKNPLNKNSKVLKALEEAHGSLLRVLTEIFPGEVILSYHAGIMHYKMIDLITKLNGVSPVPEINNNSGPYMAVPFGKILEGVAVPNTVTKALHTEKYFSRDVSSFTIEESGYYSPLTNQVKTIKSFNRPVILVDDLLHKGYRVNKLDPILKENHVEVVDTVVGVLTGRGRDLMTVKERTVEGAYFLPNLNCWIDEAASYPFIGGDSIKEKSTAVSAMGMIPSLNLVLPYTIPSFLGQISGKSFYDYSMVCLENSYNILKTLEKEYQIQFERKLTLDRLGEVIFDPKRPDLGENVDYDENMAPSVYVAKDIEKLIRLRKIFR